MYLHGMSVNAGVGIFGKFCVIQLKSCSRSRGLGEILQNDLDIFEQLFALAHVIIMPISILAIDAHFVTYFIC
jgi:hypothetical protein